MRSVWIIGAGNIAKEYLKVLKGLNENFTVVGRGDESAKKFEKDTGVHVITGGVEKYCPYTDVPDYAIVTVYPALLPDVSNYLLDVGVKNLLVEKPGGMTQKDILGIAIKAKQKNANVYIAYNRRFNESTIKTKKLIDLDGGVRSFNFEFTEWEHVISQYDIPRDELEGWLMANSTHVIDLAFYLGGIPETFCSFIEGSLDWHHVASRYSGAGRTKTGALFSYKANWASAGRWSVEILTDKNKYLLEPLETLKIQEKGTVRIDSIPLDSRLDEEYKPGLFRQVKAFLDGDKECLIDVEKHSRMAKIYELMETNGYFESNDEWNSYREYKIKE